MTLPFLHDRRKKCHRSQVTELSKELEVMTLAKRTMLIPGLGALFHPYTELYEGDRNRWKNDSRLPISVVCKRNC